MIKKSLVFVPVFVFVFLLSGCTIIQEKKLDSNFLENNKNNINLTGKKETTVITESQPENTESKTTTNTSSKEVEVSGKKMIVYGSDSIKIIYPEDNTKINVGDTLTVKVNISDFEKLDSFMLIFQGNTIFEKPTGPVMEYKFIVNGESIENQPLAVLGNFSDNGKYFRSDDSKLIQINPLELIKDFNVKPEVIMIEKGKTRRPNYEAIFPTAISMIGETNLFKVLIKDENLLSYDNKTNSFTALAKGETMAKVSYRGITKNVFFNIIQYEKPPID
ncbi:MAG: hypothetical protein WCN88_03415 [Candidatus Falkowbacteria bacterium]